MQEFQQILVGISVPQSTDGGEVEVDRPTAAALQQARDVAAANGGSLTLMCVLEPTPAGLFTSQERAERIAAAQHEAATGLLDSLVSEITAAGVQCQARVLEGEAWLEICLAVQEESFDLVMIGTRNRGMLSRLLFGGTGLRLLRNCPCPVWVVRPREEGDLQLDVLVATQLDEVGERALGIGVRAGQLLDARLHVVHAVDNPFERRMGLSPQEIDEMRQQLCTEREQTLQSQLAETDARTLTDGVRVDVVNGPPDICVLSAIEEYKIELLIMGTAARGGIPGVLVGNTAERLLPEVPCSVLALKPDDFVSPVRREST